MTFGATHVIDPLNEDIHASAEYRLWLLPRGVGLPGRIRIERIGAALFYDGGTVSDSVLELPDERLCRNVHHMFVQCRVQPPGTVAIERRRHAGPTSSGSGGRDE